ncbi:hypothetical protein HYC85_017100 [Camellia sinensis]|uniref:WAT1-related protein n=1 Tax=Camellia sinensis TaxID=4442 RepID=A0A7J7H1K7_CAMSI|nr:hypothetical protein HYC85_017100 [Camellia sinensis]
MEGGTLPFLAMVIVQVGYAGMNILSKLAMDSGMNPFVHVAYRQIFASIKPEGREGEGKKKEEGSEDLVGGFQSRKRGGDRWGEEEERRRPVIGVGDRSRKKKTRKKKNNKKEEEEKEKTSKIFIFDALFGGNMGVNVVPDLCGFHSSAPLRVGVLDACTYIPKWPFLCMSTSLCPVW